MTDSEPRSRSKALEPVANRNRALVGRAILLGILHGGFTLFLIGYSFGSSMESYEGNHTPGPLDQFVAMLVEILAFPVIHLWNPWMSKNLPDILEWIAFLGNSLLWGTGLAWITTCRPKRTALPGADPNQKR